MPLIYKNNNWQKKTVVSWDTYSKHKRFLNTLQQCTILYVWFHDFNFSFFLQYLQVSTCLGMPSELQQVWWDYRGNILHIERSYPLWKGFQGKNKKRSPNRAVARGRGATNFQDCRDLKWYYLYLFAKSYIIMWLTRSLKTGVPVAFGQDVFNTHGLECTHSIIRIFLLKSMTTLLGL